MQLSFSQDKSTKSGYPTSSAHKHGSNRVQQPEQPQHLLQSGFRGDQVEKWRPTLLPPPRGLKPATKLEETILLILEAKKLSNCNWNPFLAARIPHSIKIFRRAHLFWGFLFILGIRTHTTSYMGNGISLTTLYAGYSRAYTTNQYFGNGWT